MDALIARWRRFWSGAHETGQTLTEYALVLLFVAIAVVAAVGVLGTQVAAFYTAFGTLLP